MMQLMGASVCARKPSSWYPFVDLVGFAAPSLPNSTTEEEQQVLEKLLDNNIMSVCIAYLARCGGEQGGGPRLGCGTSSAERSSLMMLNTVGTHKEKGTSFHKGKCQNFVW